MSERTSTQSPVAESSSGLTGKKITKAEINELPLIGWNGEIELIETVVDAEACVAGLMEESLLGFDTETRPTFKKGEYYPPALVQLATASTVYLFRIGCMGTLGPLISLFEEESVEKSGVAVFSDLRELKKLESFTPRGFIDVGEVAGKRGIHERGLRPLTALLLGGRISKAAQVSNWARRELDAKQIHYAATDAWVSRELLVRLRTLPVLSRDTR